MAGRATAATGSSNEKRSTSLGLAATGAATCTRAGAGAALCAGAGARAGARAAGDAARPAGPREERELGVAHAVGQSVQVDEDGLVTTARTTKGDRAGSGEGCG